MVTGVVEDAKPLDAFTVYCDADTHGGGWLGLARHYRRSPTPFSPPITRGGVRQGLA